MQAVQFVALDILSDGTHTLAHVLAHKLPYLKQFHQKHHEKQRPDAMDTFYNHPVDTGLMITARIVVPLLMLVPTMGIGIPVIILFLFWSMFTEMSHHSTHPIAKCVSLGFIPGRLYPVHHLEHHLRPQYNYGENWIFWDRMMGTVAPDDVADAECEVDEDSSTVEL